MHRDIVVMGASAGGVEALSQVVSDLPADFGAAIFVVLHLSPHSHSVLPSILTRAGKLPARHPADDEVIRKGTIYVAPPDFHLLLHEDKVRLVRGPRENGHRPAVDPLFRSAARYYGPRVIGVVLSGALDDGTAGLASVKRQGGIAVVQDPANAFHPGMPTSAVRNVPVDHILPLTLIGAALNELVQEEIPDEEFPVSEEMTMETDISAFSRGTTGVHGGTPSGYTCPECHGALFEIREGEIVRYRCRVGHAFSPGSLLAEQASSLEGALWVALRALEESASLARRVADRAREKNHDLPAERFDERAREAENSALVIREVLLHNRDLASAGEPEGVDAAEIHSGISVE